MSTFVIQLLGRLHALFLQPPSVNTNGFTTSFIAILWEKKVTDRATHADTVLQPSAFRTLITDNQYLKDEIHYSRSPAERGTRKPYICLPTLYLLKSLHLISKAGSASIFRQDAPNFLDPLNQAIFRNCLLQKHSTSVRKREKGVLWYPVIENSSN
jgi:hypothetical protein